MRLETELSQVRLTTANNTAPKSENMLLPPFVLMFHLQRVERTCTTSTALRSWLGAVRMLRAKRCGIIRFVTKSRRSKALQALHGWRFVRRKRGKVDALVGQLARKHTLFAFKRWAVVRSRAHEHTGNAIRFTARPRVAHLQIHLGIWVIVTRQGQVLLCLHAFVTCVQSWEGMSIMIIC